MSEATIKIKTEGAAEAKRAADEVRGAWGKAATEIQGGFATVAKSVAGAVTQTASDIARIAFAVDAIDFVGAVKRNMDFQQSIARMAVGAGKNLDELKTKFQSVGSATFTDPQRIANFTAGLTKTTYAFDQSAEAAAILSREALLTGRSLEDLGELGALFVKSTSGIEGMEQALAKLRGTAKATGLDVRAALDFAGKERKTFQAFSDPEKIARQSTALVGQAVKMGYTEEQAQDLVGGLVRDIASDPRGWGRTIGKGKAEMHDKLGRVNVDLFEVLSKSQGKIKGRFGGLAQYVAGQTLGQMPGAFFANANLSEAQRAASEPIPAGFSDARGWPSWGGVGTVMDPGAMQVLRAEQDITDAQNQAAGGVIPWINKARSASAEAMKAHPWLTLGGGALLARHAPAIARGAVNLAGRALPLAGRAGAGVGTVLAPALAPALAIAGFGATGFALGSAIDKMPQSITADKRTISDYLAEGATAIKGDVPGVPFTPAMLSAIKQGGPVPIDGAELGQEMVKAVRDGLSGEGVIVVEVRNYSDSPVEATTKNKGKGAPQ